MRRRRARPIRPSPPPPTPATELCVRTHARTHARTRVRACLWLYVCVCACLALCLAIQLSLCVYRIHRHLRDGGDDHGISGVCAHACVRARTGTASLSSNSAARTSVSTACAHKTQRVCARAVCVLCVTCLRARTRAHECARLCVRPTRAARKTTQMLF